MAPKKKAVKTAVKATKKAAKRTALTTASGGIHPPPCLAGEIEFDDAVTGQKMCRKV